MKNIYMEFSRRLRGTQHRRKHSSSLSHAYVLIVSSAIAICPINTVFAQNWEVVPRIRLNAEFDDNKRLRTDDQEVIETRAAIADVAINFEYSTPTSSLRFIPRYNGSRHNEDQFDSDDVFLVLNSTRTGLRSELRFDARFASESIFTSEIPEPNFDDGVGETPGFDDTGQLEGQGTRDRLEVSSTLLFNAGEVWRWGIEGELLTVDFSDGAELNRTGFDAYQADFLIDRAWSERTRVGLSVIAATYEAADVESESDSVGADVRIESDFSSTLTGRFSIGAQKTDSDFLDELGAAVSSSDSTFRGSVELIGAGEVTDWRLNLLHSTFASSSGFPVVRDEIRLDVTRRLSQNLRGQVAVRGFTTSSVDDDRTESDRDFFRGKLGLVFMLRRNWFLRAAYTFTWQDRSMQDTRSGNRFSLGIEYRPRGEVRLPRQR